MGAYGCEMPRDEWGGRRITINDLRQEYNESSRERSGEPENNKLEAVATTEYQGNG